MRKMLMLGLLLVGMVYALPLAVGRLFDVPAPVNTQDSLAVHAEKADVPRQSGAADTRTIVVQTDGQTREMDLETYVAGVLAAEISPTFPREAIRAQAVAARTYAVYKQAHGRPEAHADADVCDDFTHCAAYIDLAAQASGRWGDNAESYENTLLQAVRDTAGEVVLHEGTPIIAVFCAAAGPRTESALDVWGGDIPYLQSVDSPGGEDCPKYRAEVTFTAQEFRSRCAQAFPAADLTGAPDTWFRASERTAAGGIKNVKLGGVQVAGVDVRQLFGLNSTNFTITPEADTITFHTIGYGHGVGLSQYGAKYMAEQGSGYREILTHYYKDTQIGAAP